MPNRHLLSRQEHLCGLRFGAATSDRLVMSAGLDNIHIFTTCFWIIPTTFTSSRVIWNKGSAVKYLRLLDTAGNLEFVVSVSGATNASQSTSTTPLTLNRPNFIAASFSTADLICRLYIGSITREAIEDTSGRVTGIGTGSDDSGSPHVVGCNSVATFNSAFQGGIFFYAHFNRQLSVNEIRKVQFGTYPHGCDTLMNLGERDRGRSVLNYSNVSPGNGSYFGTITGAFNWASELPVPFTPYHRRRGKAPAGGIVTLPRRTLMGVGI